MKYKTELPREVLDLAYLLADMPEGVRAHLAKTIRLSAQQPLTEGSELLEQLLGTVPSGARYRAFEKKIRSVQRRRKGRR